jgi:hypothetical protein
MYRLLLVTIAVAFMNVSLHDCIQQLSSTPGSTGTGTPGPTGPTTPGPTGATSPTTPSGPVLDPSLCKTEGFFRNPHDCTLYYRCFKEGDHLVLYDYRSKPCPSGLVFDEKTQVCAKKETTAPCNNVP